MQEVAAAWHVEGFESLSAELPKLPKPPTGFRV